MAATVIIIVALVVIAVIAIASYRKKLASGCCGTSGETVKKNKVQDKNKEHYPYTVTLNVDGMTCQNCSARVENALNGIEGVWAHADVSTGKVMVRMKEEVGEDILRRTVNDIGGYTVMSVVR